MSRLLQGCFGVVLLSTLVAASSSGQSASDPQRIADDPDTGLFMRICNDCHDSKQIVSRRRTRADWEEVINKMMQEGLNGTEKDLETIFAYLNRNYGRVFINRAPADEIVAILTVSQKDAEAIVAYRKTSGPFADLDALRKVPGIDLKKIEDRKDAIAF